MSAMWTPEDGRPMSLPTPLARVVGLGYALLAGGAAAVLFYVLGGAR